MVLQKYISAENNFSLDHLLRAVYMEMFFTFCSAAYAILISHVFGLLYLSQPFCIKVFVAVQ